MKAKALSSKAVLKGHSATMTIKDEQTGASEAVAFDLSALLQNPAALAEALFFAARTRLRNSTGGKTLAEAVEIVREMAESITAGKWEARAREAGETRHSPLIQAIAAVLFAGDLDAAQAEYDAAIAATCAAQNVDPDPADDDEAGRAALRKIKTAYRKELQKTPAINATLLRLEAEASQRATDAKLKAAADAAKALQG